MWLEDLSDRKFCKRLVSQDVEVLLGLGASSKVASVVRRRGDLSEHILGILGVLRVQGKVSGGENIAAILFLETFHSFQIDDGFDNMKSLNKVKSVRIVSKGTAFSLLGSRTKTYLFVLTSEASSPVEKLSLVCLSSYLFNNLYEEIKG